MSCYNPGVGPIERLCANGTRPAPGVSGQVGLRRRPMLWALSLARQRRGSALPVVRSGLHQNVVNERSYQQVAPPGAEIMG